MMCAFQIRVYSVQSFTPDLQAAVYLNLACRIKIEKYCQSLESASFLHGASLTAACGPV